jgi:hypothetical protein
MGAHFVIRKRRMTREDIQYLLDHADFISIDCFLKETCRADFNRTFKLEGFAALHPPGRITLQELPDSWIDFEGDVVFNNMGFDAPEQIQRILGTSLPVTDSGNYDPKRNKGGAITLVSVSGEAVHPPPDPEAWLGATELRAKLEPIDPSSQACAEAPGILDTMKAISARGFDCRILL